MQAGFAVAATQHTTPPVNGIHAAAERSVRRTEGSGVIGSPPSMVPAEACWSATKAPTASQKRAILVQIRGREDVDSVTQIVGSARSPGASSPVNTE